MALLINTATGFKSPASALSPSLCASNGIAPPPANGSRIGGGPSGKPPVDLGFGFRQYVRIVGVLPHHQPLKNPEQALPLFLLFLGSQRLIARRIINQRRPNHRPSRSQRPTSPPQMQRRRMPMFRMPIFSLDAALLIAASGNATSISFGRTPLTTRHCTPPHSTATCVDAAVPLNWAYAGNSA